MSNYLVFCFNVYQIKLGEERQVESSEREVSDEQVGMVCSDKARFKYKKSKSNIDMISSLFPVVFTKHSRGF